MSKPISIQDVQAGRQIAVSRPTQALERATPFSSTEAFETAQRMATALNASTMVPPQYQGRDNIGNALIALEVAQRSGASVFAVMQNLHVIHGRPSWSSKYLIATVNQSGRFSEPLSYEFKGKEGTDDWGCRARTVTKSGTEVTGPWITIAIAKKEGWYGKNGSKWQTMPELMLRYRAASMFCNTVCPELALGMQTVEEVADIIDIDPETGEVLPQRNFKERRTAKVKVDEIKQAKADAEEAALEEEAEEVADPETQTAEEFDESLPWPKGEEAASPPDSKTVQLRDRGFYEYDGNFYNANDEEWNPEIHATGSDGFPVVNSDGSYRARRGTKQVEEPAGDMPDYGLSG